MLRSAHAQVLRWPGLAPRLENLVSEHDLSVRVLAARARREHSACCWAVLPDEDAREIDQRLASGKQAATLAHLEASAQQVGQILPSDLTAA